MDVAMFSSSLEVLSFVLQKEGNGVEDALEYGKKNKSVKRCQPCSNTQIVSAITGTPGDTLLHIMPEPHAPFITKTILALLVPKKETM